MGFGPLVVSNHDLLAPGAGFDEHVHSGVDLVTYVVSGALQHRDSTGHASVVEAGRLQVLHAGDGVRHSERNALASEPVEYVQMWVTSPTRTPSYEALPGRSWQGPVASLLVTEVTGEVALVADHLYVVTGSVTVHGKPLAAGDALRGVGAVGVTGVATLLAWTFVTSAGRGGDLTG